MKPILRKTESENRSKPFRDLFVSDPVIEDSDENAENLSDIDEEMVDNGKESAVIPKQVQPTQAFLLDELDKLNKIVAR